MTYRVTKYHRGDITDPEYPSIHPTTLEEFKNTVWNKADLTEILSKMTAENLPGWDDYIEDIKVVLEADYISETFDAESQTLVVVQDWPTKALSDKWDEFRLQVLWDDLYSVVRRIDQEGVEI